MQAGEPVISVDTKKKLRHEVARSERLADRRPGLCRRRSPRPVLEGLARPWRASLVTAGAKPEGKPKDPVHPEVTGKGQTGRVNCVNLR